jgi:hypothetical protein
MSVGSLELKFSAPSILCLGVSDLVLDGMAIQEVAKEFGVSRASVIAIRDMSAQDVPEFCSIVEARKAAVLKIDYKAAIGAAQNIITWSDSQVMKMQQAFDKYTRRMSHAQYAYKLFKYKSFIEYLSKCLFFVVSMDQKSGSYDVPAPLIRALQDMRGGLLPLYTKVLFLSDVIRLEVDSDSMETCLASLHARVKSRKLVQDLIKAGAHLPFIQKYNGHVPVDIGYYREWRRIHEISKEREDVSVRKGADIWSDYNSLVLSGIETVDIYFELRRKHKLRIETLYSYVQKAIEEEANGDDDDDDLLELVDILSK